LRQFFEHLRLAPQELHPALLRGGEGVGVRGRRRLSKRQ
jgi:hypothetical protein